MIFFLDSSFIIALADADDQFHDRARELMEQGNLQKTEKIISDLVLSESVTGVAARLGQKAGMDVFENLFYDSKTKIIFLNKRLCERTLHVYLKYGRKLSFADIVSVRIMYDHKIKSIVSFDSDFDVVEGVSRIPKNPS